MDIAERLRFVEPATDRGEHLKIELRALQDAGSDGSSGSGGDSRLMHPSEVGPDKPSSSGNRRGSGAGVGVTVGVGARPPDTAAGADVGGDGGNSNDSCSGNSNR